MIHNTIQIDTEWDGGGKSTRHKTDKNDFNATTEKNPNNIHIFKHIHMHDDGDGNDVGGGGGRVKSNP